MVTMAMMMPSIFMLLVMVNVRDVLIFLMIVIMTAALMTVAALSKMEVTLSLMQNPHLD